MAKEKLTDTEVQSIERKRPNTEGLYLKFLEIAQKAIQAIQENPEDTKVTENEDGTITIIQEGKGGLTLETTTKEKDIIWFKLRDTATGEVLVYDDRPRMAEYGLSLRTAEADLKGIKGKISGFF